MEFKEIFDKYEALVAEVDKAFGKIAEQTNDGIGCGEGCSDCCHALFDLTLVEALYLNKNFNKNFKGLDRSKIMENADNADRQIHRIKRRAFKASQSGTSASEILKEISQSKVRCPLLTDDNLCAMYEARPLTCRIYGVPMNIGGEGKCCQKSGFDAGKSYPSVNMDTLQAKLGELSEEIADSLNTSLRELPQILVPVSMALVTEYTPEYLGANTGKKTEEPAEAAPSEACSTCTEDKSACKDCNYSVSLGQAPE